MWVAHQSTISGLCIAPGPGSNASKSLGTSMLVASHASYASTLATTSAGSPPSGIDRAHCNSGRRLCSVGYGSR